MTEQEIRQKAESFGKWYHALELFPGYITDGQPFGDVWDNIAAVRDTLDYKWKTVLDLGTMDGRWAFDAEARGGRLVVASDVWPNPRLLFARDVLKSNIGIITNADVHCLHERLQSFMRHYSIARFDIVQCMGVLYHVQNPVLALHQIRRVIADDGVMLLETGAWTGGGEEPLARLNRGEMLYADGSTYWMMNLPCWRHVLQITGFELIPDTLRRFGQWQGTERIAALCKPVAVCRSADDYGA